MKFVSQATHETIVKLLQDRIGELQTERDFYRKHFLERSAGVRFPDPIAPQQVTAVQPQQRPLSEVELRKTFKLDRSDWTDDDREFFEDYWAKPQAGRIPNDELDYWYRERYGNQLPVQAFLESAYPRE